MEKVYGISQQQAKQLVATLNVDNAKGIFSKFEHTQKCINSAIEKLKVISMVANTDIQLSYEETATLRANGYLKGNIPSWYYPKFNQFFKVIRN